MNGELKAEGGSITEGIGSSRITKNFAEAQIDGAFSISDQESLPVLYDLIQNEGLSLGTSCGVNIAGAIRLGKDLVQVKQSLQFFVINQTNTTLRCLTKHF